MSLLETVPNLSEGRDSRRIDRIVAALEVRRLCVLDVSADADHHRTVVTAVGEAGDLAMGLEAFTAAALAQVDLRSHRGVHPRLGVVDVVPIVPLPGATMAEAAACARDVGLRLGEGLDLPVFLYGHASPLAGVATAPGSARRRPIDLRRLGEEGVAAAIAAGDLVPDFGPARVDPARGVTLVGARPPMVAFNVVLDTGDVRIARAIAAKVRAAGGGLPGVEALGLGLPGRGLAQVSTNVHATGANSEGFAFETTLSHLAARVQAEAEALGATIVDTEIVGLVPRDALRGWGPQLPGVAPSEILEKALESEGCPSGRAVRGRRPS
ncbi:MAG: glutamate formimidoyltransferase [Thermoanaerobaculia bacterium]|nr:glutamate formimidoyltransferase [Thermoanaerobaculia bacterium]